MISGKKTVQQNPIFIVCCLDLLKTEREDRERELATNLGGLYNLKIYATWKSKESLKHKET